MILFIISIQLSPVSLREVATLADSMNAGYADGNPAIPAGTRMKTDGGLISQERGIVKWLYDSNVEVVIEAPAKYEFKSAEELHLYSGRVFAKVPPSGRGFTISTQLSKAVDLGTEFGVICQRDENTELHVFKGKTMLIAGKSRAFKTTEEISTGQARSVDATGNISAISLREKEFVRDISSKSKLVWRGEPINLADIVGGGNGFGSGRQFSALTIDDRIIASDTARIVLTCTESANYEILSNPLIDSLFIPKGKTQICSQKTVFTKFPDTAVSTFGCVTNGGIVAGPGDGWSNTLLLGGKEYGRLESPMIHIHSNMGITFDLNHIRQSIPDLRIVGFSSLCGITETAQQMPGYNSAKHSQVDFRVLVDGVVQFKKEHISLTSGPIPIDIKLNANDRYLSLAVTDSDGSVYYDWSIFAMPRLEVISNGD